MLLTRAVHGFSCPEAPPLHGFSSLAWISSSPSRAFIQASRKRTYPVQGIALSFLRFENVCSRHNSPSLCNLRSRGSSMAITAVPLSCEHAHHSHDRSWVDQAGHAIFRASLLALACAVIVFSKKMAVAAAVADPGVVGVPSLMQHFKNGVSSFSPKLFQVFEVFRDQGLVLCLLLGLSAFFSMAETSITTLWPWKVRELAEKEKDGTGVFQMLKQDVTRFLTTILIGTTVANIAATALVTDAATALFGEAGVTAATGVMTVVILLLTEITPKSIAVHNATEVARIVVRPVAWLSYILYPAGRVVTAISGFLLKLLGLKSTGEPFVTEEELKLMLRGAELSGAIEEEEQDMIENLLEIKDTYVREVMTPLVDVVAIDSSATLMDFRNLWVTQQYSRVPVFERRVDNIVGIAYAMDMLDYVEQVDVLQKLAIGRIAHKPAYFVPDSMSVWNLLREFRIRKVHMAIVLNEYGGTVGLVTLEDVVEEIVGEIFDENDSKEEIRRKTGYIVQRADGVFDVDANTSIEDLTEALEVKPPEVPYHYETVSGFVCEAFGYIPRTGESINVILRKTEEESSEADSENLEDRKEKFQKYRLEILAGNARKVGSIRFERLNASEDRAALGLETSIPSPLTRQRWKEKRDVDYDRSESTPSWEYDGDREASASEDDDQDSARARNLIAESIDVDSITDPEVPVSMPSTDGLAIMGDQDCDLNTITGMRNCDLESDGADVSTATAIDTLYSKWEKHQEYRERRIQQRRKHSPEMTVEVDRSRKFYLKRKEGETIRIVRKQTEEKQ